MNERYKIQYFNKQHQLVESDWRPIDEKISEPLITSIWFNKELTKEQYSEFMKQIEVER
jgi:hypothetical protein